MAILFAPPRFKATDKDNNPIPGAFLAFFATQTSTPQPIYADYLLTIALPNPVKADANGLFPAIWLDDSLPAYKYIFTSPDVNDSTQPGAVQYTGDPYNFVSVPIESGDVLKLGLVPNDPTAAAQNTALLRSLTSYKLNPIGWTGQVIFQNTTGADFYEFNDFIDNREGVSIDLRNCIFRVTKAAPTGNENNAGALMFLRDSVLENGTIELNFPSGTGTGCTALFLGARGNEGSFYNPLYDAVYFAATGRTMGNITIRNINIKINAPGQRGISMLGGLQNVLFENVWIDGQNVSDGFYGEYGFATDGAGVASARQSSHGNNIRFVNFKATNLVSTGSGGIAYNGAYNVMIDGLRVLNAPAAFSFGFGEAYYAAPWSGQDGSGATKRTVTVRNVVGKGLTASGGTIQGANTSSVATGYAAGTINALPAPALYLAQSDLVGAIIDGVFLSGTSAGNGLQIVGADRIDISNARIIGFGNGIQLTNEVTRYSIKNVDIFDSSGVGIVVGANFPVWSPARNSVGSITGCFIAGSGSNAINLAFTDSCRVEVNRFGYLLAHDGKSETTQDIAVNVASTATGVICDGNYVSAVTVGVAYAMAGTSSGGNNILNASGVVTNSGLWENALKSISPNRGDVSFAYVPHADYTTQRFGTALTANRAMTLSTTTAVAGDRVRTLRTGLGAFTLTVNGSTVLPISATGWCEHEYDGSAWNEIGAGSPLL